MGWTYTQKPENIKDWMKRQLTWETDEKRYRCIDVAMVNFAREAYGALEIIEKATFQRRVVAVVYILSYNRDIDYNFGYKDMDENMLPWVDNCPKRILDLLTPTDNEYARQWREMCWSKIKNRTIKMGAVIQLEKPLVFSGGPARTFKKVKVRRRRNVFQALDLGGLLVRLPKAVLQSGNYELVKAV